MTAKIFHTEEPEVLRGLLGTTTAAKIHKRRLRRHTKGCVVSIAAKTQIGEKAFSVWGPRVLNSVAMDAVFDKCPEGAPEFEEARRGPPRMGRAPADDHAVERAGYYARLRDEYKGKAEWRDEEGRVRVWTDGSRCLRGGRLSAGAGVFYGMGHHANRALPVPGRQCNARAELCAVLHVLRTEPRPVVVRSDCKYVVDGVNFGRKAWRAKAWFRRPLEGRLIKNADLWKELDQLLELREAPFEVKWTKGHPLPRHVREQVTTELDSYGNVGADFLAGVASAQATPAQRRAAQREAQQPREEAYKSLLPYVGKGDVTVGAVGIPDGSGQLLFHTAKKRQGLQIHDKSGWTLKSGYAISDEQRAPQQIVVQIVGRTQCSQYDFTCIVVRWCVLAVPPRGRQVIMTWLPWVGTAAMIPTVQVGVDYVSARCASVPSAVQPRGWEVTWPAPRVEGMQGAARQCTRDIDANCIRFQFCTGNITYPYEQQLSGTIRVSDSPYRHDALANVREQTLVSLLPYAGSTTFQ
eukprot:gene57003-biopygen76515